MRRKPSKQLVVGFDVRENLIAISERAAFRKPRSRATHERPFAFPGIEKPKCENSMKFDESHGPLLKENTLHKDQFFCPT